MSRVTRIGTLVAVLGGVMVVAVFASEPTVVTDLDLERYMGQWYAVAHIPTTFERRCVSGIAAHYRLLDDGRIEVTNSCCEADGELQRVQGRAWIPDPSQPGKLKVTLLSADSHQPAPAMVRLVWSTDGVDRQPSTAIEFAPLFDNQGHASGRRRPNLPGPLGDWCWCIPEPFTPATSMTVGPD